MPSFLRKARKAAQRAKDAGLEVVNPSVSGSHFAFATRPEQAPPPQPAIDASTAMGTTSPQATSTVMQAPTPGTAQPGVALPTPGGSVGAPPPPPQEFIQTLEDTGFSGAGVTPAVAMGGDAGTQDLNNNGIPDGAEITRTVTATGQNGEVTRTQAKFQHRGQPVTATSAMGVSTPEDDIPSVKDRLTDMERLIINRAQGSRDTGHLRQAEAVTAKHEAARQQEIQARKAKLQREAEQARAETQFVRPVEVAGETAQDVATKTGASAERQKEIEARGKVDVAVVNASGTKAAGFTSSPDGGTIYNKDTGDVVWTKPKTPPGKATLTATTVKGAFVFTDNKGNQKIIQMKGDKIDPMALRMAGVEPEDIIRLMREEISGRGAKDAATTPTDAVVETETEAAVEGPGGTTIEVGATKTWKGDTYEFLGGENIKANWRKVVTG